MSLSEINSSNSNSSWFNEANLKKAAVVIIALLALANVGLIFKNEIGTFFQNHQTLAAIGLPALCLGLGFGALLKHSEKRKAILLTFLVAIAALYLISGASVGFNEFHHWLTAHASVVKLGALAFGIGISAFFALASHKAHQEKAGKIDAMHGFEYGELWTDSPDEWHELLWETSPHESSITTQIPLDKLKDCVVGQVIKVGQHGQFIKITTLVRDRHGRLLDVEGVKCDKGIVGLSEKRPVIGADGQPTGEFYYLVHVKQASCHTTVCAATALIFGFPLRFLGGLLYNILRVVALIPYLLLRTPYDLYTTKDSRLDLLGKRIIQIHKVIGDSLRNIVKSVPCFVAAELLCLVAISEGLRKGRPLNSEKMLSQVEMAWNDVPLREAYWSIVSAQPDFKLEGGFDPDKLNEHGFYVMGCAQSLEYAVSDKGKLKIVKHLGGKTPMMIVEEKPYDITSFENDNNLLTIRLK
jgi:hypothetical protein